MADNKWDKVDAIVRKQANPLATTEGSDRPLVSINDQIEVMRTKELDIIGRFKRRSLERRTALEQLRDLYTTQLSATKHQLKRALDVEKERVDAVANKYIFQITEEYLRNMRDLGLQNYESRMDTLLQLNETMARLLQKAQAQDIPESTKQQTIENVMKKYQEFCDRLMEEEIKLSK